MPHAPMASPLMAPSVSPSSRALGGAHRVGAGADGEARLHRVLYPEELDKDRGPGCCPGMPVRITATTVTAWMPPWLPAIPIAMGVVTDLGMREAVMASSSRKRRYSPQTLPIEVGNPLRSPPG